MNVNAGQTGDELAALVLGEIDGQPDVARQIVYSRVLRAIQGHGLYRLPKPPDRTVKPMNDVQAKAFEESTVPKWAYKGSPVADVPLEYLENLADPDAWLDDVRRYLASARAKRRREYEAGR